MSSPATLQKIQDLFTRHPELVRALLAIPTREAFVQTVTDIARANGVPGSETDLRRQIEEALAERDHREQVPILDLCPIAA